MDPIVPFVENLYHEGGKFIKPDGTILFNGVSHAFFAQQYCELSRLDIVTGLNNGRLSKDEIKLLELWEDGYVKRPCEDMKFLYPDFLTYVLGWDKICSDRTIITTDQHPHYRLYNYYLDGWKIESVNPYRVENGEFVVGFGPNRNFESEYGKEREYEEKGAQILKLVKPEDIHLYFE